MGPEEDTTAVFLPVAPKRGKATPEQTAKAKHASGAKDPMKDATNQLTTFTVLQAEKKQIGLTMDELEPYVNDPFWVRMRWILVILFWVIWAAMFTAAIVIVVISPKCPVKPTKQWWEKQVCYHTWIPSFSNTDESGVSNIAGLKLRLPLIASTGVNSLRLACLMQHTDRDCMAVTAFDIFEHNLGTMDDFHELVLSAHNQGMKVLIDIPLSTSGLHTWFQKYKSGDPVYEKFYAFHNIPSKLIERSNEGNKSIAYARVPGSTRSALLNVDVPGVRRKLGEVFRAWRDRGVDGFVLYGVVELQTLLGKELSTLYKELREAMKDGEHVALFANADTRSPSLSVRPNATDAENLNAVSVDALSTVNSTCDAQCFYSMLEKEKNYFLSDGSSAQFWQISSLETDRLFWRMKNENRSAAIVFLSMMLPGSVGFVYGEELGLDGPVTVYMCWVGAVKPSFSNDQSQRISDAINCPEKSFMAQSKNSKSYYSLFSTLVKYRSNADAILYGGFDAVFTSSQCIVIIRESKIASESIVAVINVADKPCVAKYHTDMKLKGVGDIHLLFSTMNFDISSTNVFDATMDRDLVLSPFQAVAFKYRRSD